MNPPPLLTIVTLNAEASILAHTEGMHWEPEPDRGLSGARNKGIREATGIYIDWLNADDYYQPGALRRVGRAPRVRPRDHRAPVLANVVTSRPIVGDLQAMHASRRTAKQP